MTVLETIQKGSDFLTRKGVDSPRLQIELLLEHVLKLPRLNLYLEFEREVTPDETSALRTLIQRRGEGEPLQHLIGNTCFCGIEIDVNRNVLIPRPETELLAERAWNCAQQSSSPVRVLDFGTGSGCLPILIALKCPEASVHAIDISKEALAVAEENARKHGVDDQIEFHLGDGFDALPDDLNFDLIVSNPPYIPSDEIASLQKEVRDYDPRLALDGGADGLDFYRRLATEGIKRISKGGTLMLEIGDGQGNDVSKLLQQSGWSLEAVENDYAKRERMVIAHRHN